MAKNSKPVRGTDQNGHSKLAQRQRIPDAIRHSVLLEAGYKCANPNCREMLALELHHMEPVRDGGGNTPDNLIALCGSCHNKYERSFFSTQAIVAWKGLLISLNNPNRTLVDLMLVLYDEEARFEKDSETAPSEKGVTPMFRFTGDGLSVLAPLITSNFVEVSRRFSGASAWGGGMPNFEVRLTERGRGLVEAWRAGNPDRVREVLARPRADARKLTDAQRKNLASALIDQRVELDKIAMRFSSHGGNEAREYAEEIAQVFRDQGWNEDLGTALDDDHRLTGLKLWYQPDAGKDPNAARLADALEAAGIDFDWTPHDPPYSDTVLFVYRSP